jgi:hypothetical protein
MSVLNILKIVAGAATILTGLISLVKPRSVFSFTGLVAEGGRGITEIRAVLGAFFIALGAMVIYYRLPQTYTMLGVTYLAVGLVRAVSMFVDKSVVRSNLVSLAVELILGGILVIPG